MKVFKMSVNDSSEYLYSDCVEAVTEELNLLSTEESVRIDIIDIPEEDYKKLGEFDGF